MTDASRKACLPLLFPPQLDQLEEQRASFARRFAEFDSHLEACRADVNYRFTVTDLDVFRAYFDARTDERTYVRELVKAQRVTVPHLPLPPEADPVQAELWRRNMCYGAACWEGLLGGTLGAKADGAPPPSAGDGELRETIDSVTAVLIEAEKLSTLSLLAGARYPEVELDRAWRQVLFAQRGLSASGGPAQTWYVDLMAACREAVELGMMTRVQAMIALSLQANTAAAKGACSGGASLLVANVSGAPYSGTCTTWVTLTGKLTAGFEVRDHRGRRVPLRLAGTAGTDGSGWAEISFQVADMPAIGYRTYSLRPAKRMPKTEEGAPAASPLAVTQTTVHPGVLPPELALFTAEAKGAEISVLRPLGNPLAHVRTGTSPALEEGGVLLRVRTETAGAVTLDCGLEVAAAWQVDLLEQRTADLPYSRAGWRRPSRVTVRTEEDDTVSLALRIKLPAARSSEAGATSVAPRLTYCRYWEHNAGAVPAGNAPLGLWAGGQLPLGKNTRFPIYLSNDSADREYAGTVNLLASEQWTLIPRRFPYRIAPRAQGLFEAMVVVPEKATPCFLRVETQDGERMLQDVLPVGEIEPLQVSLARGDAGFALTISNPNPDYVEGQATLVTPLGTPEQVAHSAPHVQPFRVGASGTASLRFTGEGEAPWAVARVVWYGRVQYVRVDS